MIPGYADLQQLLLPESINLPFFHMEMSLRIRLISFRFHRLIPAGLIIVSLIPGLYGGASQLRPAWWVFLVVVVGTLLFMLGGMTAMIRARFSTPTVGREGMIGEDGTAEVAVDPDGVVLIRGSRWRARTNRATPIKAGDPVKVVAVEGLVLEVEPPEGGARDYRERGSRERVEEADSSTE